jgi:ATP synthase protein I
MADMRPGSPNGERDATGEREALDRLSRRIDVAREGIDPRPRKSPGKYQGLSVAWRMVLELVIGCGFGAAIGYAIDDVAGTGPLFLVVFGLLGFAAGVKTMMASARQMQRKGKEGDGLG